MDLGKKISFIIMASLILSTACMSKTGKDSAKTEKKEKAPNSLVSVGEGIDEMLSLTVDMDKILKLSQSELQVEMGGEKKQNKALNKDEEITKRWNEMDTKVEKIHKDWNSYEVEGVKKGGGSEKGKTLKDNLNLFTIALENRNIMEIMDTGSRVENSLAPFFNLYKDEIRGDLAKIKYVAYQSYLKAEKDEAPSASKLLDSTEDNVSRIRQKLDKDKEKIRGVDKLGLSIGDMKQSLGQNSLKLLAIKRDIILENIKTLEK